MKKKIVITAAIIIVAFAGYETYRFFTTRNLSPAQKSEYSFRGLNLKVTYGQPSKRGRLIFGEKKDGALVPYGKYWRLGANDATEISFNKDIIFGGKPVQAGKYRMYAVTHADTWQISLNNEIGKSGLSEPDYTEDVIKVDIPVGTWPSTVEQFIITFSNSPDGAFIDFVWDKTKVHLPIVLTPQLR
jgi:Protein of unknown function (DUF2911)